MSESKGEVVWADDARFSYNGIKFLTSEFGATIEEAEAEGAVWLMKNPRLLELYEHWIDEQDIRNIVEVGVAGGGSAILLNERYKPERMSLLDIQDATSPSFKRYMETEAARNIAAHFDVDQGNRDQVDKVLTEDFGDRALDLVIDDASHFYEQTVATFEVLFPKVRAEGIYVIEDWGWSHWPGDYWQGPKSPWRKLTPMSNLIQQLVMAAASKPGWVARMYVTSAGVVVQKGPDDVPPRTPLSDYYLNRGKPYRVY